MKSIKFKNFRQFVDFPLMNFNDITLLVGQNNSGKSTVVKAILLIMNYLKNQQNQTFSFSDDEAKQVNIVSFDRARCKYQKNDEMYFEFQIGSFYIELKVSGSEVAIDGEMECIRMKNNQEDMLFEINYSQGTVSFTKNIDCENGMFEGTIPDTMNNKNKESILAIQEKLKKRTDELNDEMGAAFNEAERNRCMTEYLIIVDAINRNIEKLQSLSESEEIDSELRVEFELDLERFPSNSNFIDYVREFLNATIDERNRLVHYKNGGDEDELLKHSARLEELNYVLSIKSEIENCIDELVDTINKYHYYYWSVETQKQSALFSIKDKNNALSQALHDFYKLQIQPGQEEHQFILKQLKEFEVGESFEIIPHVGEAYECFIIDKMGCQISLADKGMGSIQVATLIFRLASIISKHKRTIRNNEPNLFISEPEPFTVTNNVTLIIEEPELNLHPKLQSKLSTLFYSLNKDFGVKFIVETHSEYLIRQSQVIAANLKCKDDFELEYSLPFAVIYFPALEIGYPYSMNYQTSGRFSRKFGEGFFDEAANSTLSLSKLERENRN